MEEPKTKVERTFNGFSPVSTTPILWKSRKRSVTAKNLDKASINDDETEKPQEQQEGEGTSEEKHQEPIAVPVLSQKRKALFEPLEPITLNGQRPSNESLLPPPDFESPSYPKGWLVGKKRKLVNVDVVESMRRIAVQEMNRKDREIDGLNEQLEEDARCLEHLQLQLVEERSKRADVERQNSMLQNQITMLMNMLEDDNEPMDGDGPEVP